MPSPVKPPRHKPNWPKPHNGPGDPARNHCQNYIACLDYAASHTTPQWLGWECPVGCKRMIEVKDKAQADIRCALSGHCEVSGLRIG